MTISIADLHKYLQERIPDQEDKLFGYAAGNQIGAADEYLFDTPHNYWDYTGDLPENHSQRFPDKIYDLLKDATRWVDIVTMNMPNDRFLDALVVGIGRAKMKGKGNRLTVRILMGSSPPTRLNTGWLIGQLEHRLKAYPLPPGGLHPHIFAAQLRWRAAGSWNHAKLISIDGKTMLTGGHNMWTEHYLQEKNPVFDLTLRYDGPIARSGHVFANGLWAFVTKHNNHAGETYCSCMETDGATYHLLGHAPSYSWRPEQPAEEAGSLPALWVTNPGWGVFKEGNGDSMEGSGLIALIRALKDGRHCRFSQQDLGAEWYSADDFTEHAVTGFPFKTICCGHRFFNLTIVDNLAEFLLKDSSCHLDMVLTSPESGWPDYTNHVPLKTIFNVIGQRMSKFGSLNKEGVLRRLGEQVTVKTISFSKGRHRWPNGNPKFNHGKFWMVDDLFYVGSENLYPSTKNFFITGKEANLQEFGVLTQATPEVQKMILQEYFEPMLAHGVQAKPQLSDLTWPE